MGNLVNISLVEEPRKWFWDSEDPHAVIESLEEEETYELLVDYIENNFPIWIIL